MEQNSDNLIIELFNKNDKSKAFDILVNNYKQRIYYHIRRMVISHEDADDLTQDTFIKIWNNIGSFKGNSSLFTWIYRIATNEAINFLNRKKRFLFFSIHDYEEQLSNSLNDDNYLSGDAIQIKLQKAILTLPQKQRLVFNMKYFEEMKYEKMSEILDTSVGALKASYHLAVKKIEKYLDTH